MMTDNVPTDNFPTDFVLTGERTWPGIPSENYWFMRHLACYQWAARAVANADSGPILDAGSGEGYGAAAIAEGLDRSVIAVELDAPTAVHARVHYPALAQVRANLVWLPFGNFSFAAAVSLQVIEHIWDPLAYLRELARCTSGPIIISTPNRVVHSPGLERGERPVNPFHVREFDAVELIDLLNVAVTDRAPTMYGLIHAERIRAWEHRNGSLPSALLESAVPAHASDVAQTVGIDDFTIELLREGAPAAEVHDLVALW